MKYLSYSDLPPRVRAAILKARPTIESKFDEWIKPPIPALKDKSVIDVLDEYGEQGESEIIALCHAISGRF